MLLLDVVKLLFGGSAQTPSGIAPDPEREQRAGAGAGILATCLLLASTAACASTPDAEHTTTDQAMTVPVTSVPVTTVQATTVAAATTGPTPSPTASTMEAAETTNEVLRAELVEMMRQDQLERTGEGLPPGTPLPPIQDYTRATRLAEIVDEFGWPTVDLVGDDGSTAAWLIAQHADHDVDLQLRWLDLMEAAVDAGQADPTELAYLTDRVAVNQDVPQRFGTQIRCRGGEPAPATPIEDAAAVDERRQRVGLEPLADYYGELAMMCEQEAADGQGPAD